MPSLEGAGRFLQADADRQNRNLFNQLNNIAIYDLSMNVRPPAPASG
jgi:hypothetical protein